MYCWGLALLIAVLFVLNLLTGSVPIPANEVVRILLGDETQKASWQFIVLQSRLPQALTAMLSGAALAVSGLLLQTAFRNPLAGPSVFGISSQRCAGEDTTLCGRKAGSISPTPAPTENAAGISVFTARNF